jgi:two-component system chemotaxis response regulator CheB
VVGVTAVPRPPDPGTGDYRPADAVPSDASVVAPVRIVTVDAIVARRRILRTALLAGSLLEVVGEAAGGREAMEMVERLTPDVLVVDLDLPAGDGPSGPGLVGQVMAHRPMPVVAHVSDGATGRLLAHAAFAAGAVAVLSRPTAGGAPAIARFAEQLLERVQIASRVLVAATTVRTPAADDAVTVEPAASLWAPRTSRSPVTPRPRPSPSRPEALPTPRCVPRLVVIGASTGGPAALAAVLTSLPADLAVPVLVVQHIAAGFLGGFASWLDGVVALSVRVGVSGEELRPGDVVLAPEGRNAVVDARLRLVTQPPAPGQLHVPGVDATFSSAADVLGPAVIGVLLTGMGRDGAVGLAQLHTSGAVTLAQDEQTSAVFGMPAAARDMGAVDRMLPLPLIGPAISVLAGHVAPEAVS